MKNFKISIAWLAMLALIFTSCSKEETDAPTQDDQLIQLTFGSVLNDFSDQNKQATPGEVCRDEDPAYAMVAITDASGAFIDDGDSDADDLFQVNLKWNTNLGVWETEYSPQLGLPAGNYQLEHFVVFDSGGDVLWVAPRSGGSYADYVGNELPLDIVLQAGTKPYISIDVLCYVARNEEAYGYIFFDINPIPVENSFCVFVNYCDDETGREYPAYFGVEVWTDGYDGANEVDLNMDTNEITAPEGAWPSASVLCFPLPDLGENGVYYVRVSVLDHSGLAYTANSDDYTEFTVTQADIDAQKTFLPAYEHLRINCAEDPEPGCDIDIACELNMEQELDENCYFTELEGADASGFVRISSAEDLELLAEVEELGNTTLVALATASASVVDGMITIDMDTPFAEEDRITAFSIEVRPSVEGDNMSTTCWESRCGNTNNGTGSLPFSFDGFAYEYPFYVRVNTVNCFEVIEPQ